MGAGNFNTAMKNYVSRTVAATATQYGNVVRIASITALGIGMLYTFGNAPVNPGHATASDIAVPLLARETGTGSAKGTGTGAQVITGITKDGSIFTTSGAIIIGPLNGAHCIINHDGTYSGCGFTGTGFTLIAGDARYLRKAGSTETGQLIINYAGGSVDISAKQTLSGAYIQADSGLFSSGALVVKGNATIKTLSSCTHLQTNSNGLLSCNNTIYITSAGQGLTVAGGSLKLSTTNSGSLSTYQVQSGSTVFATKTLTTSGSLKVLGNMSGGTLNVGGGAQLKRILSTTATLDFANLVSLGCEDLTVSVGGAALGDVVSVGVPNGSIVANGNFFGWVSSSNTVSVRFCTFISGDPASGTFRVAVNQY